jgi:hypothetical protein
VGSFLRSALIRGVAGMERTFSLLEAWAGDRVLQHCRSTRLVSQSQCSNGGRGSRTASASIRSGRHRLHLPSTVRPGGGCARAIAPEAAHGANERRSSAHALDHEPARSDAHCLYASGPCRWYFASHNAGAYLTSESRLCRSCAFGKFIFSLEPVMNVMGTER